MPGIRGTNFSEGSSTASIDALAKSLVVGKSYFVDGTLGLVGNDGLSWKSAMKTIGAANAAMVAGDTAYVAPGDYDETLTITKDNLTFMGVGARTSVSIAPSASNANAVFVDGTTASGRVEEVTFININGDANGTGIGLYLKGNIRRIHTLDCKWEAGDTTGSGIKLESTAAGSVGDVLIEGGEVCWAQTGISVDVTGGGDAVTQVMVKGVRFHDITANHVINASVDTLGIELKDCTFHPLETGTGPTGLYVDLRAGATIGGIYGCYFPVAVTGGKVLVDTGVAVLGCYFTGGINTAAPS